MPQDTELGSASKYKNSRVTTGDAGLRRRQEHPTKTPPQAKTLNKTGHEGPARDKNQRIPTSSTSGESSVPPTSYRQRRQVEPVGNTDKLPHGASSNSCIRFCRCSFFHANSCRKTLSVQRQLKIDEFIAVSQALHIPPSEFFSRIEQPTHKKRQAK